VASTAPPFSTIAIAGLGLIGGSLALAIRRHFPSVRLLACDREDVLRRGLELGAVDEGSDGPWVLENADLIVLAAPVRANVQLLLDIPRYVSRPVVVTDVGSTKTEILDAARSLPETVTFVGGHPLAGAAAGGIDAATPEMFEGCKWIFTTPASDPALEALEEFTSGIGAMPVRLPAAAHDPLLAYTSHLPQLAISALMHVAGEHAGQDGLALAGPGLRDSTRLAASSPEIWRDIAASNAPAIREALDRTIAALQEMRDGLDNGDPLQRIFDSAAEWKRVLDASDPRPKL
jgi:prephenate dehydrogenase